MQECVMDITVIFEDCYDLPPDRKKNFSIEIIIYTFRPWGLVVLPWLMDTRYRT